ncbi:MAG: hypothetical protein ABI620_06815 [Chloroflexota bacterium]
MPDAPRKRAVRLEMDLDDEDLALLRGALLAARGAELAELQRRAGRLSYGYGTDSAREGMSAEVVQSRRRKELLDELLAALDRVDAG